MLIFFILFAIFLLTPAVYVFKGFFENISVSLVASESEFTFKNYVNIFSNGYFVYVINSLINPIFIIFAKAGLINSPIGLILCYTAFITPFTIYLMVGYLTTIPKSLDEAAIVDGVSRFTVVCLIIIPIMWPGLVAAATFAFLQSWSEFLMALAIITDDDLKTIPLGLYQYFGDVQIDWGVVMAGSVVATVPTLLLFLPLQRKLVSGLTQGATK